MRFLILFTALFITINASSAMALTKKEAQAKIDEYRHDRAEQIVRNKNAMRDQNKKIADIMEKQNKKANTPESVKEIDEKYLEQLGEIAETGNKDLWQQTYDKYIAERKAVLGAALDPAKQKDGDKKDQKPPSWGTYKPYKNDVDTSYKPYKGTFAE